MMTSRWAASLAGALLIGSLFAAPAVAHDSLVSSDPPDGAVLDAAPEAVVLEFSGNILDLNPGLEITGSPGEEVSTGPAQIEGTVVTWELTEEIGSGDYDVVWVVTSQDGHPIDGTFTFSVAAAEPTPSEEPTTTSSPEESTPAATPDEPEAAEPSDAAEATPDDEPSTSEPTDPSDISSTAEAWFFAGLALTVLVVVGVLVATRRNRDPNGPPGQS